MKAKLQDQAGIVFCALQGVSEASCCALTGRNHKMVERLYTRLHEAQASYVEKEEGKVNFGGKEHLADVEADEVDVRKWHNLESEEATPV
eukprot:14844761-Alexandrium_andersonii.AAC.1